MESSQPGSERDKGSSPSPITVVCSFWRDFDLEKERSGLDEQGIKIAENQENSQKNRRKLAESTRDFKKASADEKLNLFASLLKSYQEEVDNLTKRAKFGENAFLNIYQKLYEAPDPYPALASIAEQDLKFSELESENRKMKIELEEYRIEATHLKNQQATTIRRLEERNRQLEQQITQRIVESGEGSSPSVATVDSVMDAVLGAPTHDRVLCTCGNVTPTSYYGPEAMCQSRQTQTQQQVAEQLQQSQQARQQLQTQVETLQTQVQAQVDTLQAQVQAQAQVMAQVQTFMQLYANGAVFPFSSFLSPPPPPPPPSQ